MKTLLKKVFLLAPAAALLTSASAQVNVADERSVFGNGHEVSSSELMNFQKETLKRNKREVTEWYNYINSLAENGERFTYFTGTSMMNDSLAVQILRDADGNPRADHVGLFGVGQVIDPKSFYLFDPTPGLSIHNPYTIDSVGFFYKYNNVNPGVVDTLLIQFFNNDGVAALTWQSDQSRTAAPTYRPSINRSPNPTTEIKVPISETTEDFYGTSVNSFSGFLTVATGLSRTNADRLTAFAISFIPGGWTYNMGDTISNDSLVQGVKKLNAFMPLIFRQGTATNPATLTETAMAHGIFAFANQRYSTQASTWYFPYNPPGTLDRQHLYALYRLNSPNVSVDEVNELGYGLGNAYPNPAISGSSVNIPFAIGNADQVQIEVFNIVGSKVASAASTYYPAGSHVATISTENLTPGVYTYTISSGAYSATKKFSISK